MGRLFHAKDAHCAHGINAARLILSKFAAELWLNGMEEGLPTRLQIRILARSATAPHPRLSARLSLIGALVL